MKGGLSNEAKTPAYVPTSLAPPLTWPSATASYPCMPVLGLYVIRGTVALGYRCIDVGQSLLSLEPSKSSAYHYCP